MARATKPTKPMLKSRGRYSWSISSIVHKAGISALNVIFYHILFQSVKQGDKSTPAFNQGQLKAHFPFFPISSSDKPQLRALNEKSPRKDDLRKAYEIPRGFPRYSRHTHAVLTPSPPPFPFFEPKIFKDFLPDTIRSGFFQNPYKPKRRPEDRLFVNFYRE